MINCIIVIYNTVFDRSNVYVTAIEHMKRDNVKVYIVDNSEVDDYKQINSKISFDYQFEYIDMFGNQGISKAYNKVISQVDEEDWVLLLDQDSKLGEDFFDSLLSSTLKYPDIDIHVPIVMAQNRLVSPSNRHKYHVKRLQKIGTGKYSDVTAINSGMLIRKRVYSKIGLYNEALFLDYVDHFFLREYFRHYDSMAVHGAILQQSLSTYDHSSMSKDLSRFKIYVNDFEVFCNDSFKGYLYYTIKVLYRAIKLCLVHRNLSFLTILKGR